MSANFPSMDPPNVSIVHADVSLTGRQMSVNAQGVHYGGLRNLSPSSYGCVDHFAKEKP